MFYSPLRYPGGKSKLIPFIHETIELNELEGSIYVEPFAGGAAIAWYLLSKGLAEKVYINDLNPSIYAFWWSVLKKTDELCAQIDAVEVSLEEWKKQREIYESKSATLLERGFSTFFLNRTNRSGIIAGGPIGGADQSGNYPIDCRFNKADLISRIVSIAEKSEQVVLTNLDGAEFIEQILPNIQDTCFVNIDPPYYVKGKGLYQNFFEHSDHVRLAEAIKSITHPWILTYDKTPEICDIYHDFTIRSYDLSYTAQEKRLGKEVLIQQPEMISCVYPPSIPFSQVAKNKRKSIISA